MLYGKDKILATTFASQQVIANSWPWLNSCRFRILFQQLTVNFFIQDFMSPAASAIFLTYSEENVNCNIAVVLILFHYSQASTWTVNRFRYSIPAAADNKKFKFGVIKHQFYDVTFAPDNGWQRDGVGMG